MTDFSDTLEMIEANAAFNANAWNEEAHARRNGVAIEVTRKPDTTEINGLKVHAYAVANSGRSTRKNWWSIRWYLNDKVVSRANLIKKLAEVAA